MPVPCVSVCIPAFNHEKYVGAAIESVLAQTMDDFEIVITDDASTDRTVEIIRSYDDPRIRFFSMPRNSGPGAAANNNFRNARGEFVALLASDDVFVPHKLESQVSFLRRNPNCGVVFSWMTYVDESGDDLSVARSTEAVDIQNRSQAEWLRYLFFSGNPFSAPTALLRRSVLQSVGPIDSRLLQVQDMELWIRMCMVTQMHILPERLIRYRIREGLANASANTVKQQARTYWEMSKIYDIFRLTPPDLFDAAFRDSVPEYARELPRDAQLAILALSLQTPFAKSFGLDLAYSLLGERALLEPLGEAELTYPWLFQAAAEADPFQVGAIEWFRGAHAAALSEVSQLKEALAASISDAEQRAASISEAEQRAASAAEKSASDLEEIRKAHAMVASELEAAKRELAQVPRKLRDFLRHWNQWRPRGER